MANDGVKLSRGFVRLIAEHLRRRPLFTQDAGGGPAEGRFWAELVARTTTDDVPSFSWKRLQPGSPASPLEDGTPSITGENAIVVQGGAKPGDKVILRLAGCDAGDDADEPWYIFESPGMFFPVNVASDGGSAGNADGPCTFTYVVAGVGGGTLPKNSAGDGATGMSPVWARPALGAMTPATHGTAYYNSAGNLVLYQVDEVPLKVKRDCGEGGGGGG